MLPLLLLALGADAADPMLLHPSPGARVVVLPRSRPDLAEIGVYENRFGLRAEVDAWRAPGLARARAVDVTGRITFVLLELTRDDLTVEVEETADGTRVRLVPGDPAWSPSPALRTVDDLLAGLPRRPAPLPARPLLPLTGDAAAYGLSPRSVRLRADPDAVPLVPGVEEATADGWEGVDAARRLLATTPDPAARAFLLYRLGVLHGALGYHREAAAYLGWVPDAPAGVHLARADAALRFGDWDTARAACGEAHRRGADPQEVLACLGALSLATAEPPPGDTGRALARVARRSGTRLLAGALLLRDGYAAEALPLLHEGHDTPSAASQWRRLAAGDAALLAGDPHLAHEHYLSAPPGPLDGVLRVRRAMIRLSREGIDRWPSAVPELTLAADAGASGSADALWLLAQIHARYGDLDGEAGALGRLWDLSPYARRSDVPRRLLDACGARVRQLADRGDAAGVASTWADCWRDGLRDDVADVTPLALAAAAWSDLGVPDRALALAAEETRIRTLLGRDDVGAYARLASLQVATGVPDQALETVAFARRLEALPAEAAALALVAGDAEAALGRPAPARASWALAARWPGLRDAAGHRRALLDLESGDCAAAAPPLARLLAAGPLPSGPTLPTPPGPGELELRVAWCFAGLDQGEEAVSTAALAASRTDAAPVREEAAWLASAVSERLGVPLPDALRSEAAALRAIREDDAKHAAFRATLDAWTLPRR